jgi:poly-gamma-glutamate synthesis protein (capsule biosynthesis protein)
MTMNGDMPVGDLNQSKSLSVFLCGDVMTGRGIDQVLPQPGDPTLYESCVSDAREYVKLAERVHGPIQRPVGFKYIWGDALAELHRAKADVRIVNLETSITSNDQCWPEKGIHYRMHPRNIGCLTAARVSACCLANNHVLDWGHAGLRETLESLDRAGIAHAGAGSSEEEAAAPAVLQVAGKGRLLLFSLGSITSGIPREWGAARDRPGINLLRDLSEETAARIGCRMRQIKQRGDVVIASIHWGGNWGYEIPKDQITFSHRLIEEGFDLIHGHSSHHAKGIEIFKGRLVLYGCGDFINDYEGITGYEEFRGDLALMYLVQMDSQQGHMMAAEMVPMQMRRFRLSRASAVDAGWICALLNRLSASFGTQVRLVQDKSMVLG